MFDAITIYIQRYADEARKLAAGEKDAKGKLNLKCADVCEWIKENPSQYL